MLKHLLSFKFCIVSIFFLSSCTVQETESRKGKVYEQIQVSKKANFEGGKKQLIQFLSSNLDYPSSAILNNVKGKVLVKFIVEDNGTINDFVILKDIGNGCADELIKALIKTQSRWNAAKINNKRVRSNYILGVNFKIPKDNSKPYIQDTNS